MNVTNITNITNVTNITNITNVTNVTNITYRNRELPGAVTVVPDNAFRSGQEVRSHAVVVPAAAIVRAGAVPVVVDSVYELDEYPSALKRLESGAQFGKVMLRH